MTMKNPPHPGLSVRHDCIEPLGLTITEAAEALGVTRQTLNNLVNGKSGISADMAIRLDKAFGPFSGCSRKPGKSSCSGRVATSRRASTRAILSACCGFNSRRSSSS